MDSFFIVDVSRSPWAFSYKMWPQTRIIHFLTNANYLKQIATNLG